MLLHECCMLQCLSVSEVSLSKLTKTSTEQPKSLLLITTISCTIPHRQDKTSCKSGKENQTAVRNQGLLFFVSSWNHLQYRCDSQPTWCVITSSGCPTKTLPDADLLLVMCNSRKEQLTKSSCCSQYLGQCPVLALSE